MGFTEWFEKEAKGWQILKLAAMVVVFYLAWGYFISEASRYANYSFSPSPGAPSATQVEGRVPILSWYFPVVLVMGATIEEFLFRFLPLVFAVAIWGSFNMFPSARPVLIVAFISSIIFGALHGGWDHALIQGMAGMLLSLLFLKCGGWEGNFIKALAMSSAAHVSINAIVVVFAVMDGARYF